METTRDNLSLDFSEWLGDEGPSLMKEAEAPMCPDCKIPMVLKNGKYGPFYGCPNWRPGNRGCNQISKTRPGSSAAKTPAAPAAGTPAPQPQGGEGIMTFGKHNGKPVDQVPLGYLIWLTQQGDDGRVPIDRYPALKPYVLRAIVDKKKKESPAPAQTPQAATPQPEEKKQEEKPQLSDEEVRDKADKHILKTPSEEQAKIDAQFAKILQSPGQSHLMINALAGTGKTTVLKHLAWKYGKPGERWLYLVFNTKNKVEGEEKFPQGERGHCQVDVRTTNGFLGEVIEGRVNGAANTAENKTRINQTQRIVNTGDSGETIDKMAETIADNSPEFAQMMKSAGILDPDGLEVSPMEEPDPKWRFNLRASCIKQINGLQYYFRARTGKLAELAKAFAVDPRKGDAAVKTELQKIVDNYDLDLDFGELKENIMKMNERWRVKVVRVLQDYLGFNILQKSFKPEIIDAAVWLIKETMPGASKYIHARKRGEPIEMGQYRDFADDLWYAAIHANELVWPHYKVVLADEVQDFNACQQIVLKKLHEAGAKIVAVGDPNQSLYRFRGADDKAFHSLGGSLQGLSTDKDNVHHTLTKNFRSAPENLKFAEEETGITGLKAGKKFDKPGVVTKFDKSYDDAFGELAKEKEAGKLTETAFIARTNAPLAQAALRLLAMGIPFTIVGRDIAGDLLKQIRQTMERQIQGHRDLKRTDDVGYLQDKIMARLERENAQEHGGSAARRAKLQETEDTLNALSACIGQFTSAMGSGKSSIADFENWLSSKLKGFDIEDNEKDYAEYRKKIEQEHPVVLTTGHKAKGLEWDRIYVLRYDQWPHIKAQRPEDKQQELNNLYVTLTRARTQTHVLDLEGQPGYKSKKKGE